jgi:Trk K+ transport system NAD-binding subunit
MEKSNPWLRRWKASWRDTNLLLREFRVPLLVFLFAIVGAGLLYQFIAARVNEPVDGWLASVYRVLTMVFLQSSGDFPHHPLLQIFYFVMPIIGIGALAQGLADFGILLFNRRARSKEWEMAVASTFSNHTILIGLGHLGYRVVNQLHAMDEQVVVIELNPSADQVSAVQKMGIPVIQDDAARPAALESAGVERAKTIMLCTQNDALNLQIAVKARSINPRIRVVIRIFDEDFARSLQEQFGFTALSATAMAAPAFAASAAGVDITSPITVEGESLSLVRIKVGAGSALSGKTVGEIEQNYDLSIVLLKYDGTQEMHPSPAHVIPRGATLAVLGAPERLNLIVHDNQ